jgi:hypothetical protein
MTLPSNFMGLFCLIAFRSLLRQCSRTERARINSQDSWADALEHSFSLLKSKAAKIHDIDSEITVIILNIHAVHLTDRLA